MARKILFTVLLFTSLAAVAAPRLSNVMVPYESVAVGEDVTSFYINPAGMAFRPGQVGFYKGWLEKGDRDSFSTMVSFPFLALAYDSLDFYDNDLGRSIDLERFNVGLSFLSGRSFSIGMAWRWFYSSNAAYDSLSTYDLGLIWRPFDFISTGVVARQLNQPDWQGGSVDPLIVPGAALRPFGDRMTFSADFEIDPASGDIPVVLGAQLNFPTGPTDVVLGGNWRSDTGDFGIRLAFEVQNARLDFFSSSNAYNRGGSDGDIRNFQGGLVLATRSFTGKTTGERTLYLELNREITESRHDNFLFPDNRYTTHEIVDGITRAKEDPGIRRLFIRITGFSAGWGKVQEIRAAIADFKKSGKEVIMYLEQGGNREYYLASVGSEVVMPPPSTLMLVGLKAEMFFIRDLLDKVGVEADFIPVGEYKSAMETFMRNQPSDANRRQMTELLQSLSNTMRSDIATSRGLDRKAIDQAVEQGFLNTTKAREAGLIDREEYYHNLVADMKKESVMGFIEAREYFSQQTYRRHWGNGATIAVVHIDGTITDGKNSNGGFFGSVSSGSDDIAKVLEQLRETSHVKGVVLRVDSPGGSGLASDIMWKSLMNLKAAGKKLYISFSDTAASGGYYVATAGEKVFASPGTITGSIGVFGGKFTLKGLYEKLGINKTIIRQGKNAAIFTEADRFSDSERMVLREHLKEFYELFLKRVADGRQSDRDKIHQVAQGRVWTGEQAKEKGLVDKMGGLAMSIEMMRQSLKIPREHLRVIHVPKRGGLNPFDSGTLSTWLGLSDDVKAAAQMTLQKSKFKDSDVIMVMPYKIDVK